jgi:hypothetical protein
VETSGSACPVVVSLAAPPGGEQPGMDDGEDLGLLSRAFPFVIMKEAARGAQHEELAPSQTRPTARRRTHVRQTDPLPHVPTSALGRVIAMVDGLRTGRRAAVRQ